MCVYIIYYFFLSGFFFSSFFFLLYFVIHDSMFNHYFSQFQIMHTSYVMWFHIFSYYFGSSIMGWLKEKCKKETVTVTDPYRQSKISLSLKKKMKNFCTILPKSFILKRSNNIDKVIIHYTISKWLVCYLL